MNLRPYQQQSIAAIEQGFGEFNRQLAVLPTGAGKTVLFSHAAMHRWQQQRQRTLILVHREELLQQAVAKLQSATGIEAQIERADDRACLSAPVVVASIQSLHEKRIQRFDKEHFGLVVCDEAHHALSKQWQSVLGYFNAQILGVTATPDRGDKRNLGEFFESIACEVSLLDLIRDGYLVPITVKSIPLEIDLRSVSTKAGDFDERQLAGALEPWLGAIVGALKEHASFRKMLAFCPLISTSVKFVESCRAAGLDAEHVDGNSEDREQKLADFAAGKFDILSNAMLLTEGYDCPAVDCILPLRPTQSRALFSQMVGRGTRTAPCKRDLLLLDFLWMHERHKLVKPAHLIAKDEIEADTMTELLQASGGGQMDLLEVASDAQGRREEALRKRLEANKGKRGKTLSAIDWCVAHGRYDVADYEPTMRWETAPPTDKQITGLRNAGVDVSTVTSRGQASKLLDIHHSAKRLILASPKERALAARYLGHQPPETFTRNEFRKLMGSMRK